MTHSKENKSKFILFRTINENLSFFFVCEFIYYRCHFLFFQLYSCNIIIIYVAIFLFGFNRNVYNMFSICFIGLNDWRFGLVFVDTIFFVHPNSDHCKTNCHLVSSMIPQGGYRARKNSVKNYYTISNSMKIE